ncbi:MAG: hypothetical protein IJT51_03860 [Bacteroidales bacterium]|nr:hypothetical protein [Bacteroidales bacterium]
MVRDADGKLVTGKTVGAKISLNHNAPNGSVVYSETHTVTTNAQGLAMFNIGGGAVVSGSLQNIDWGDGTYFLKSEIDITGGTNYTLASSQQVLGVPLAHYAQTAGNLPVFDYHALPDTPTVVSHFINDAGYLTHYDETQELSFSNDTLFLTGGSYVVLPIPRPNTDSLTNIIDSLSNVLYSMHRAPKVQTLSFVAIDSNNAEGAGEVVFEGLGGSVTARGFCWNITGRPTLADNVISQGSGVGVFTTQMQNLTKVNTYYVRAFAINATDTVFGTEVAFVTAPVGSDCDSLQTMVDSLLENNRAPMVITMNFAAVDTATVTGDGEVIFEGLQGSVSSRGFCYNTTGMPTLADSMKSSGSGLGTYTLQLEGLTAATKYYVRAFAINATDTAYGNEITVTTFSLPVVTTDTAYAAGYTRAKFFGTVAADGGNAITSRGFVYNTGGNPTMSDTIVAAGSGQGTFSATASQLDTNTTYYVRAFAINELDTVYGDEKSFATFSLPDFRIDSVHAGDYFAAVYVTIADDGGDTIMERGFCFSVDNATPTRSDNTLICGKGSDSFTDTLKKLNSATTYYVTAYIITPNGLYYSTPSTFTTENADGDPCPGLVTLNDYHGNTYKTIYIGKQCWMRENLRVQTFADGSTYIGEYYCSGHGCYDYSYHVPGANMGFYDMDHGLLYNYHTAIKEDCTCDEPATRQGVCPDGWVLPTLEEWQSISDYVQSHPEKFIDRCIGRADGDYQNYGDCNNNYWQDNCYDYDYLDNAYYWTYDKSGSTDAYAIQINMDGDWYENVENQGNYFGVRCIRDVKPRVTTTAMNKSSNGVTAYGEILSENAAPVTSYGFCYGATSKPTVENDSVVEVGTSFVSSFNTTISGFESNVIYYIRAYATNSYGTEYGKLFAFSFAGVDAKSCPGADSIMVDIDGNKYATLLLDGQCWMRSNLRVTQTNDGTLMDLSDPMYNYYDDYYNPYYAYPNNDGGIVDLYGNLYNYTAAMSVCPTGWHLPAKEELEALNNYVVIHNLTCNGSATYTAKALAANAGWQTYSGFCSVGYIPADNNATGFSWMPAGDINWGTIEGYKSEGRLWSATPYNTTASYYMYLSMSSNKPTVSYTDNNVYYSVRCVKSYTPVLGATTFGSINLTGATLTSKVVDEGKEPITEVGFCYNTTGMPTVAGNKFAVSYYGVGTISGTASGFSSSTQIYYVRSYAITASDTVYGPESKVIKPVIDAKSCSGATTVTDYDGNVYSTVQIGTQCWMRDNLRTTHYAGGGSLTLSSNYNTSTAYYYYPGNLQENVAIYGLVYNWPAVMNGSSSTDNGQVQGVCPSGWHVPTNSEWTTLINNVQAVSDNWCSNNSSYIAAALSADYGWTNSYYSSSCVPGNPNVTFNQSGFSALPAYSIGYSACFWSSYQYNTSNAYYRGIYAYSTTVTSSYTSKATKYSVRCIKNN